MTTQAVTASAAGRLHAGFLALLLPRVEAHARIRFRHVKCPGRRDDLVAEAVAVAWRWYLRAISAGKDPAEFPCAFASKAASHVRCGRRLVRKESARDALSPLAQARHGFVTQALPGHESGIDANEAIDALKDNTVTPPPDQAAFRCDYHIWLSRLSQRNRLLAREMSVGETTGDLAVKHRVCQARISQLRRWLHGDWHRFHGELV